MIERETLLLASLLLPFAGSVVAACLPTTARNAAAALAGLTALAGTILIASLYSLVWTDVVVRSEIRWLPSLGLNFVLRLDGLSWMFALLVLGIGSSSRSMPATTCRRGPGPPLLLLPARVHGLDARDGPVGQSRPARLLLGATSLLSFLLIGYWHHRKRPATQRAWR